MRAQNHLSTFGDFLFDSIQLTKPENENLHYLKLKIHNTSDYILSTKTSTEDSNTSSQQEVYSIRKKQILFF